VHWLEVNLTVQWSRKEGRLNGGIGWWRRRTLAIFWVCPRTWNCTPKSSTSYLKYIVQRKTHASGNFLMLSYFVVVIVL
jgi:hypothetical protein